MSCLSQEEFVSSVSVLLTFVKNLVEHPEDPKFRKVRMSNKTFQTKIGSKRGGTDCMKAVGFQQTFLEGEGWLVISEAAARNPELRTIQTQLEQASVGAGATKSVQGSAAPLVAGSATTPAAKPALTPTPTAAPVQAPAAPEEEYTEEDEERPMQGSIRISLQENMDANASGSGIPEDITQKDEEAALQRAIAMSMEEAKNDDEKEEEKK